jgi:hypothetical protein
MKAALILFVVAILFGLSALGGPEVIIRERAKELSNENNVRQGVPPPTDVTQPSALPNAPTGPTISPALVRFQADLSAIKPEAPPTAEQKQKLTQELLLAAQGPKPSLTSANKLAEDLSLAFAEKPLSSTSRARLTQELDAVLNPGKYPQAKLDGIFADIQAIFQENGLARSRAVGISNDVKKISEEIRGGGK